MVITLLIDDILSVNKADVGVIVMLPNEYSSSRTDRGTHVLLLPGITSIVTVAVTKNNNIGPKKPISTPPPKNELEQLKTKK